VREDLLARSSKQLHTMLNYAVHAENGSLYNTPPSFAIYTLGLVMRWLIDRGGLEAIGTVNARKAAKLYAELDRTRAAMVKRERLAALGATVGIPPRELCTDNAAMIGSAARFVAAQPFPDYLALDAYASGERALA
ncbi:MAG: hypothetical protein ACLGHP_08925, partial [Vicinamibacteria bacterium]